MKQLLAIDPGYAADAGGCACALFSGKRLHDTWFARYRECTHFGVSGGLHVIVIEKPQVDGRTANAMRTTLELAWQGALLASAYATANVADLVELTPAQWKQQRAKSSHHHQLWEVLTPKERALLGGVATELAIERACEKRALSRGGIEYPRSFKMHNILDAVALGCAYLGRMR